MSELLNKMFQQVFTKESQPDEPQDDKINVQRQEVTITKEEYTTYGGAARQESNTTRWSFRFYFEILQKPAGGTGRVYRKVLIIN